MTVSKFKSALPLRSPQSGQSAYLPLRCRSRRLHRRTRAFPFRHAPHAAWRRNRAGRHSRGPAPVSHIRPTRRPSRRAADSHALRAVDDSASLCRPYLLLGTTPRLFVDHERPLTSQSSHPRRQRPRNMRPVEPEDQRQSKLDWRFAYRPFPFWRDTEHAPVRSPYILDTLSSSGTRTASSTCGFADTTR